MTENELRGQLEVGHVLAFGWARACCGGDREEAEDVLQDAYLAVLSGKAQFDGRSSFRTWLFGVILRTARSTRRKSWLRSILLERNNGQLHAAAIAADSDVETASRNNRLLTLMGSLSERQRQVLHLVFYQELTIEDAARVMGVSVGSARTHYTRGKVRLMQLLKDNQL